MIYQKKESSMTSFLIVVGFLFAVIFGLSAATTFAQTTTNTGNSETTTAKNETKTTPVKEEKPAALQPVMTEYKGVALGMTADDVRGKMDRKPKVEDKDGFYYVISDNEAVQFVLDADKKVKLISMIYTGASAGVPTSEQVFGKDVTVEPNADGRIYKVINYPESGYWIAYSRSAGENPTTIVTIQKLLVSK
jgi:hypothetical protein